MYTPEFISSAVSPRRELQLQGPRPSPLNLHKNSHKIKKPPVAPPQPHHRRPPAPPPRSPVIIYAVSPKIIHTNPNEFMSLVQRLTGPSPCNSPLPSSSTFDGGGGWDGGGAVSPAARFASIEKTRSPKLQPAVTALEGAENDYAPMIGHFPAGILSPNPNMLLPISPKLFSSPPAADTLSSFFLDLSPVFHSSQTNNFNYLDNSFILPSPSSNFMISPQINLPSPNTLDLFKTLFDL